MTTFAQFQARRAKRLAEIQAGAPVRSTPLPAVRPPPVELHTVGRNVLVYAREALLAGDETRRKVAARMLEDELSSGVSRGGR